MSRQRISITIDKKLLKWLDKQVKERRFASRSHALEYLIANE